MALFLIKPKATTIISVNLLQTAFWPIIVIYIFISSTTAPLFRAHVFIFD
jgi:hypothetical protein